MDGEDGWWRWMVVMEVDMKVDMDDGDKSGDG